MKKRRGIRLNSFEEYKFDTTQSVLDFDFMDLLAKIDLSKKLISKRQLVQFKEVVELDYTRLAECIGISIRSIHLMNEDELFDQCISSSFVSLVELYGLGYRIVGNPDLFNKWMKIGSPELNYVSPLSYCDTFVGRNGLREKIRYLFEVFRKDMNKD